MRLFHLAISSLLILFFLSRAGERAFDFYTIHVSRCFAFSFFFLFVFDCSVFSVFYIAALVWASTAGGFGIFSSWKWQCAYISVGGVFRLALGTRQTWYRQDRPWSRRDQIFLIQEIGIWHYWAQISSPLEGSQPTAHSPLFFPPFLPFTTVGESEGLGRTIFYRNDSEVFHDESHSFRPNLFYVERFSDFISVFRSI